jgi:hypothetical protein
MNSHLILSLQAYLFYSFPSHNIHMVGFINEMLSKQDKLLMVLVRLVKKVIGK